LYESRQSLVEKIEKSIPGGIEKLLGPARPYSKIAEVGGRVSRRLVEEISEIKREPEWMRRLRLKALEVYQKLPAPNWLIGVDELNIDELTHYIKPGEEIAKSWEDIPRSIRDYYEKLRLPEMERKALAGLTLQFESEPIYHSYRKALEEKGVIILPMEEAVKKYPDLVKKYFNRVYPFAEHKYAALHTVLWSGGVFVYVPKGVKLKQPIEAFFLIGSSLESQAEHILIVADENSYFHFIEGCAAPLYKDYSFHNGMVEIYAHKGSHVKFVTMQNWSSNIIGFSNKRAIAEENATVEWVEGGIGTKVSYVYPSTILKGDGSRTAIYSITLSKGKKIKDAGAKVLISGKETAAKIVSKSISADGGMNIYRGLIRINKGARNAKVASSCESLILDEKSTSYTYPHSQVLEKTAIVNHEARIGRINEEQLNYLRSRGLSEGESKSLIVLGFLEEVTKDLPFEYNNVLSAVIQLEFSEYGGVG
jgi:Fe-S cluster assembly protein SufB